MPKFFVANNQIKNETIEITGEDVNHIVNVLRLQIKSPILVCNKEQETTYSAQITEISKEKVICKIIDKIEKTAEPKVKVTIFQGLPKAEKMEYIIQKSTELGVKDIVPVAMKNCVVKIDGKDEKKKIERWQKIAEVAAKQSGRDIIPKIRNIYKVKEITEEIDKYDLFIIAYENEKETTLKQVLQNEDILKKIQETQDELKVGILIGPEGGLDKTEINELQESKNEKVKLVTLGNRILRTETASLAILSNIIYEYEM